mmetsp:Transcript_23076/g.55890  ORF Transcript_23076/g.55890 Transcript_23076/m.55890 type:complete len:448 (-) Transcript_23076:126-1469(-)
MRLGDNHGDQPLWMALAERAVERVRKGLEACRNAMKKEIDAERKDSGNEEKDSKEHQLSYPLTVLINSETVLGLVALTRGDIDLAVDMLRNAYENLLVSFDDLPVENKKTRYRGSSSEDHLQLGGLCPAMIRVAALYAEALLVQQSSPGTPLVAKSEKEKIGVRFTRALRVFPVPIGFKSPELLLTFEEAVLGPGFPAILRFESERQYSPINSSGANGGQLQHLLHGWRSVVQFKQRLLAAGGKVDPTGSICSVTMSPSKDRKAQLVPPSKEAIANWLRKIDMADYLSGLEGYATDKLLGSVKVKWTPQDASGISDQNVPRFSIQKSKELWSWGKYRPSRRTLLFEKFTLDRTRGRPARLRAGADADATGSQHRPCEPAEVHGGAGRLQRVLLHVRGDTGPLRDGADGLDLGGRRPHRDVGRQLGERRAARGHLRAEAPVHLAGRGE